MTELPTARGAHCSFLPISAAPRAPLHAADVPPPSVLSSSPAPPITAATAIAELQFELWISTQTPPFASPLSPLAQQGYTAPAAPLLGVEPCPQRHPADEKLVVTDFVGNGNLATALRGKLPTHRGFIHHSFPACCCCSKY